MAYTTTPTINLRLVQASTEDDQWGAHLNYNFTQIDTAISGGITILSTDVFDHILTDVDPLTFVAGDSYYLQDGNYTPASSVTIPDGCIIVGQSKDGVIIDFGSNPNGFVIGTDPDSVTFSVTKSDTTVTLDTGTITTQTHLVPLNGDTYKAVDSITTPTEFETVLNYHTSADTSADMGLLCTPVNVIFSNVTIKGSTGTALDIGTILNSSIDIRIEDNTTAGDIVNINTAINSYINIECRSNSYDDFVIDKLIGSRALFTGNDYTASSAGLTIGVPIRSNIDIDNHGYNATSKGIYVTSMCSSVINANIGNATGSTHFDYTEDDTLHSSNMIGKFELIFNDLDGDELSFDNVTGVSTGRYSAGIMEVQSTSTGDSIAITAQNYDITMSRDGMLASGTDPDITTTIYNCTADVTLSNLSGDPSSLLTIVSESSEVDVTSRANTNTSGNLVSYTGDGSLVVVDNGSNITGNILTVGTSTSLGKLELSLTDSQCNYAIYDDGSSNFLQTVNLSTKGVTFANGYCYIKDRNNLRIEAVAENDTLTAGSYIFDNCDNAQISISANNISTGTTVAGSFSNCDNLLLNANIGNSATAITSDYLISVSGTGVRNVIASIECISCASQVLTTTAAGKYTVSINGCGGAGIGTLLDVSSPSAILDGTISDTHMATTFLNIGSGSVRSSLVYYGCTINSTTGKFVNLAADVVYSCNDEMHSCYRNSPLSFIPLYYVADNIDYIKGSILIEDHTEPVISGGPLIRINSTSTSRIPGNLDLFVIDSRIDGYTPISIAITGKLRMIVNNVTTPLVTDKGLLLFQLVTAGASAQGELEYIARDSQGVGVHAKETIGMNISFDNCDYTQMNIVSSDDACVSYKDCNSISGRIDVRNLDASVIGCTNFNIESDIEDFGEYKIKAINVNNNASTPELFTIGDDEPFVGKLRVDMFDNDNARIYCTISSMSLSGHLKDNLFPASSNYPVIEIDGTGSLYIDDLIAEDNDYTDASVSTIPKDLLVSDLDTVYIDSFYHGENAPISDTNHYSVLYDNVASIVYENESASDSLVQTNAATYDASRFNHVILDSYNATSTVTITLPDTSEINVGHMVTIKDAVGNALVNNITVATYGAETIDGAGSYALAENYAGFTVLWNGTQWNIISTIADDGVIDGGAV